MKLNTILVILNHPRSSGLLKMASELAQKSGAELKALYIENREWFEASSFSFSQQITSFRGEIIPLTEHNLSEQTRALAARFEKMFTTYSKALNIKYSYRTMPTHTSQELEEAITGVDLVLLAGSVPPTTFWIDATGRHNTPLLIWDNGAAGPREIIGLCEKPEHSLEVISWTIQLADWMNLKSRLFWEKEFEIRTEWIEELKKDNMKVAPNIIQRINNISEIQPFLTADILPHFRNALFITRRQNQEIEPNIFRQKMPIALLLL